MTTAAIPILIKHLNYRSYILASLIIFLRVRLWQDILLFIKIKKFIQIYNIISVQSRARARTIRECILLQASSLSTVISSGRRRQTCISLVLSLSLAPVIRALGRLAAAGQTNAFSTADKYPPRALDSRLLLLTRWSRVDATAPASALR